MYNLFGEGEKSNAIYNFGQNRLPSTKPYIGTIVTTAEAQAIGNTKGVLCAAVMLRFIVITTKN